LRADHVAARDDAVGEIAAAVGAPALDGEVAIAVAPERELLAVDVDRDHVARAEGSHAGHGAPLLRHLRSTLLDRRRAVCSEAVRLHLRVDAGPADAEP